MADELTSKRRPWWRQLSLRELLLLVLICGLTAGWWTERRRLSGELQQIRSDLEMRPLRVIYGPLAVRWEYARGNSTFTQSADCQQLEFYPDGLVMMVDGASGRMLRAPLSLHWDKK